MNSRFSKVYTVFADESLAYKDCENFWYIARLRFHGYVMYRKQNEHSFCVVRIKLPQR